MEESKPDDHSDTSPPDLGKLYQRIGEFAVCFQGLEDLFRQIGWLIIDPHRSNWPPVALRNLTNNDLLEEVKRLFDDVMDSMNRDDKDARKLTFASIVADAHELRKYRNTLLHSAFVELKAGGQVYGLVLSNPKVRRDPATGDLIFDQESLSEQSMISRLKEVADVTIRLGFQHTQLIHWAPFGRPVPQR